jgi:hypothetical protein
MVSDTHGMLSAIEIFFHVVTMLSSVERGYENKIFVGSTVHNRLTFWLRQDARRSKRHIWQAGFARR